MSAMCKKGGGRKRPKSLFFSGNMFLLCSEHHFFDIFALVGLLDALRAAIALVALDFYGFLLSCSGYSAL